MKKKYIIRFNYLDAEIVDSRELSARETITALNSINDLKSIGLYNELRDVSVYKTNDINPIRVILFN